MYRRIALIICLAVALWMPSFANAFAVSPATLDLSASRGETVEQTISVINNGTAEQTYYLGTISFVPDETSGAPRFLSGDSDRSGLAGWIHFPVREVTVPSSTKVDVPFVVTIPADAESGTLYAAVTVSVAPSDVVASNGATIEAKTAVLVFMTVEGESIEKAATVDFVSSDGGLVVAHDVSYAFRVQNQGNVSVVPSAMIVVTDLFGRVVFAKDANPEDGRVLPGTTRTYSGELVERPSGFLGAIATQWSLFAIGPMTATLSIDGTDSADSPAIHYWMFPWQILVTVIGAIVFAWLALRGLARSRSGIGGISTGN